MVLYIHVLRVGNEGSRKVCLCSIMFGASAVVAPRLTMSDLAPMGVFILNISSFAGICLGWKVPRVALLSACLHLTGTARTTEASWHQVLLPVASASLHHGLLRIVEVLSWQWML